MKEEIVTWYLTSNNESGQRKGTKKYQGISINTATASNARKSIYLKVNHSEKVILTVSRSLICWSL